MWPPASRGASPGTAWSTRSTSSTGGASRASCPRSCARCPRPSRPRGRGLGRLRGRLGLHAHERLPRGARRGLPRGQERSSLKDARQGRQGPRAGHRSRTRWRCPMRSTASPTTSTASRTPRCPRRAWPARRAPRSSRRRPRTPSTRCRTARRAGGGVRDPPRRLLPPDSLTGEDAGSSRTRSMPSCPRTARRHASTSRRPTPRTPAVAFQIIKDARVTLAEGAAAFGPAASGHIGGPTAQFADVQDTLATRLPQGRRDHGPGHPASC